MPEYFGSNPKTSTFAAEFFAQVAELVEFFAQVAELVDALDSKSSVP